MSRCTTIVEPRAPSYKAVIIVRWAMRILGALNVVVSIICLCYFAWGIAIHLGKWPGDPTPKQWAVFFAISAFCMLLVLYLAYLGVRLIKQDGRALWPVSFVFTSEIIVCFVSFLVTWVVTPVPVPNVIWFWGIAVSALEPQVYFGYAFMGLAASIGLIMAERRSSKTLQRS